MFIIAKSLYKLPRFVNKASTRGNDMCMGSPAHSQHHNWLSCPSLQLLPCWHLFLERLTLLVPDWMGDGQQHSSFLWWQQRTYPQDCQVLAQAAIPRRWIPDVLVNVIISHIWMNCQGGCIFPPLTGCLAMRAEAANAHLHMHHFCSCCVHGMWGEGTMELSSLILLGEKGDKQKYSDTSEKMWCSTNGKKIF